MNSEIDPGQERLAPRIEFLRVAGLLGIFAAQFYLASRFAKAPLEYCFTRPFWLDEFHTLAVIKEERASQVLFKLAQGGDLNPPGLHFPLWLISKITNLSDEVLLRSFSCLAGVSGLVATYFLLRTQFRWQVSCVAVLGMWSSSPQLVQQMFEGRTYSFWFAAIASVCLLLCLRPRGFGQVVWIGGAAAMMCSIHYFGILVLGLIAACQLLGNFRDSQQRWLIGAASAVGVLTLIAWLPLYFSQRAAVPVASWVPPPTLSTSSAFISGFLVNAAITLPVLGYAFQTCLGRIPRAEPESNSNFRIYAGALGLILWPVVLTVFSYVIQPAQLARYAVPTALAYAPLIALIAKTLSPAALGGIALLFFGIGTHSAMVVYELRPDYHEVAALVKASSAERPLVVHWRVIAYPLFRYTGAKPDEVRISYLFRGSPLSRFDAWEQAMARRMAESFDVPKTFELKDLAQREEFYLLVVSGEEQRYKHWTAEPLGVVMGPLRAFRMRRSPGGLPAEAHNNG